MKTNMQQNKKLYVLVSDKLTSIYGAVQGGHAVAQDIRGLDYSSWYEPDLDNELTAIAIYDDGYIFRNLKLLK